MSDDLRHIATMIDAAKAIQGFVRGRRRELRRNQMMRDAVVRQFVVLGEAAGHATAAVREAHPEVPWRRLRAFRQVLVQAHNPVEAGHLEAAIDALPAILVDLAKAQR